MKRKFSQVYPVKNPSKDGKPNAKMSEPEGYQEDESEMDELKVLKPGYTKELKG